MIHNNVFGTEIQKTHGASVSKNGVNLCAAFGMAFNTLSIPVLLTMKPEGVHGRSLPILQFGPSHCLHDGICKEYLLLCSFVSNIKH